MQLKTDISLKRLQKYIPTLKTIKDATKPVYLEITMKTLAKSRCGDPRKCAIALAYNEKLAGGAGNEFLMFKSIGYAINKSRTVATRYYITGVDYEDRTGFDDEGAGFSVGQIVTLRVPPKTAAAKVITRKTRSDAGKKHYHRKEEWIGDRPTITQWLAEKVQDPVAKAAKR